MVNKGGAEQQPVAVICYMGLSPEILALDPVAYAAWVAADLLDTLQRLPPEFLLTPEGQLASIAITNTIEELGRSGT